MRNRSLSLVAVFAACAWGSTAHGQVQLPGGTIVPDESDRTTRVGTRGANFLHVGIGARAQAMGGAVGASIEGPAALFWNPANITSRQGMGAFLAYQRLFANSGVTEVAGAVTVPIGSGTVGFAIQQYSSGEIDRTTENAPDGNDPVRPGTFSWTGTAVGLHYARNVTDRLVAGGGVRYAREGLDFSHNGYLGFDISTRFRTGLYGLTVAGSILNMGSRSSFSGPAIGQAIRQPRYNGNATGRNIPIEYDVREVEMPTTFNFGIQSSIFGDAEALLGANPNHTLMAEMDFRDAIDTDVQPAVGLEYGFKRTFFARVGKKFLNEQHAPWDFNDGLAFGGGVRLPFIGRRMVLDYSYTIMGELGNNQVISFDIGS